MKDKIHFWVTSLYGEDEKHPRYKLFEENHKRVPSLELKPSIDGRDPFKVIEKWIDLNEEKSTVFSNEEGAGMKNKWGAFACYLTKLFYFLEYRKVGGDALCLIEDDIILPEGFEDYILQALELSKENYNNKRIIRLGQFGEIYILPYSMTEELIKHLLLIDQAVDHKINNSDFCFHYFDHIDEIDGYKKIVDEYHPTSQENAEKGKSFINVSMRNCLMFSKGDWGNIATSKELGVFEEVFEFWNDPQFQYEKIMKEILTFSEK